MPVVMVCILSADPDRSITATRRRCVTPEIWASTTAVRQGSTTRATTAIGRSHAAFFIWFQSMRSPGVGSLRPDGRRRAGRRDDRTRIDRPDPIGVGQPDLDLAF